MNSWAKEHCPTLVVGFLAGLTVAYFQSKISARLSGRTKDTIQLDSENIPYTCPGPETDQAGKSDACLGCPNASICSKNPQDAQVSTGEFSQKRSATQPNGGLSRVRKKILVLSGKGGVGKSTVASQTAWALHAMGYKVGLLDVDICGPSIPRMTGTMDAEVHVSGDGWEPVWVDDSFAVMSIGYLLPATDDAIIWRGPKKNGLIKQFMTDVAWGELDYLLVDTPPGTSDEHLSIITYLKGADLDGAIVVTTPQEVSLQDVRKEINFCRRTGIDVLGVVENMSGSVFKSSFGNTEEMCEKMGVKLLTSIPLDTQILESCEKGVASRSPEGLQEKNCFEIFASKLIGLLE